MSEVYFAASNGRIKIGYSRNVAARMKDLAGANPHELEVIATIPGGRALEAKIHAALAAHRIKHEWFNDCAEVRAAPDRFRGEADNAVSRPSLREIMAAASKSPAAYKPDLKNITCRFSRLVNCRLLDRLATTRAEEKRRGMEKGTLMEAVLPSEDRRKQFSLAVDHLLWAHKMYGRVLDACHMAILDEEFDQSPYLNAADILIRETEAAFAPFVSDIERLAR